MARAIWSGSISFGLLNVPVKLYSAVARRNIALREIRESDSARIKHRRVAEGTDEEVPYEEIIKAYEITPASTCRSAKTRWPRWRRRRPARSKSRTSSTSSEIDPIYFDSPYYLGPADGAEKAYSLLAAAMEASGKVAVARFVFRNKEHLAAIRASSGVLTLTTMRFADEVVPASELEEVLPDKQPKVAKKEQEMAEQLIESLEHRVRPVRLPRRVPRAAAGADRTQGRRQGDRRLRGRGAAGDQGAGPDGGARGKHRRGQGREAAKAAAKKAKAKAPKEKRKARRKRKRRKRKARRRVQSEVLEVGRGREPRWSRSTGVS